MNGFKWPANYFLQLIYEGEGDENMHAEIFSQGTQLG